MIAEGISPMLDVEAAEADMELSVIAQNKKIERQGETIRYSGRDSQYRKAGSCRYPSDQQPFMP